MVSMAAAAAASATAGNAHSSAPSPKLVQAAHEFEAQMMEELMKPLTSGNGLDGEDSDTATGSTGALGQFASESLGKALSDRGGFGIADGIIKELSAQGNKTVTSQVTLKQHENTVMKFHQ